MQQCSVEHRHQEGKDRCQRRNAAHDNGRRGHPGVFAALALLLFPAKLGPADGVGILALRNGTGIGRPSGRCAGPAAVAAMTCLTVFGLGHPFSGGFWIGLGDSLDHNGGPGRCRTAVVEIHRGIFPEFLHILQHFRGGGIAVLGLQGHALEDDLLHSHRDIGIQ